MMNLDNLATPEEVAKLVREQPKLLTTIQAATIAKKNRRTIVDWIRHGDLPAHRLPGKRGHYRIKLEDLQALLSPPSSDKEPQHGV